MMNDNHTEQRSSDWIDIIWASYENAFVNAKLYHALKLWSGIERQLGNQQKALYYADFAAKLKVVSIKAFIMEAFGMRIKVIMITGGIRIILYTAITSLPR